MSIPTIAIPGQTLGTTTKHASGPGTHVYNNQIHASLAGLVVETASPAIISVQRRNANPTELPTANVLPSVDAVVLARVTRTSPRQASVAILAVGDAACADEFQGLIRAQDVRATEKDKVRVGEAFRPGDVVRAVVISLGDQSNYYLSTASNELGVVMATSELGNAMYPVSWKEFLDPVTGARESRKVAKPFQD